MRAPNAGAAANSFTLRRATPTYETGPWAQQAGHRTASFGSEHQMEPKAQRSRCGAEPDGPKAPDGAMRHGEHNAIGPHMAPKHEMEP